MQRKPNQKFQYRGKPQNEHRLNNEITATEVRLIGEGIEPAVYSLQQALAFAVELGVDLVEVSPNAVNAGFILRGLRSGLDFEYEQSIAFANKELDPDIETVFFLVLHLKLFLYTLYLMLPSLLKSLLRSLLMPLMEQLLT